jgi:hypothetical protein
MTFQILKLRTPNQSGMNLQFFHVAWEGSPDDETAPIFAIPAMRAILADDVLVPLLTTPIAVPLGKWHLLLYTPSNNNN